jgi:hypothetical protein
MTEAAVKTAIQSIGLGAVIFSREMTEPDDVERKSPARLTVKIKRAGQTRPIVLLPAIPAAATTAPAVAVATATAEAGFTRLGLVHLDVSALELRVVELRDSLGRLV